MTEASFMDGKRIKYKLKPALSLPLRHLQDKEPSNS